jgi:hypothetical protein
MEDTDIARSLGRIDAKLEDIKEVLQHGSDKFDRHDVRIRKLENRQHWYAGAAAAIASSVTVALKKAGVL